MGCGDVDGGMGVHLLTRSNVSKALPIDTQYTTWEREISGVSVLNPVFGVYSTLNCK